MFAAAGAKAKTGVAQGALAAARNFISPKNVEATAAAQARMPSMAKSFGAAPTADLSAADKAKAALEASKRSAAQPIALGAVASCGGANRGQPASALVGPLPVVTPPVVAPAAAKAAESLLKKAGPATAGGVLVGGMLYSPSLGGDKEEITAPDGTVYTKYSDETLYTATAQNGETWTTPSPQDDVGYRTWLANGGDGSMQDWVSQGRPGEPGVVPSNTPRGELDVFDGEYAARQLLGETTTPAGREISFHAADRMVNPPPGRAPMSAAEVDQVLDGATKVVKRSYHPQGDTLTIENANMPGKPRVIVDAATGNRIITVINPKKN